MKRCNHKFCTLIADAASKTCWLEAEDIPDPVKLLRLIVNDPGAVVLPGTVLVEAKKFLQKFDAIDSPNLSGEGESIREPVEVTDVHDISAYQSLWSNDSIITASGEGEA